MAALNIYLINMRVFSPFGKTSAMHIFKMGRKLSSSLTMYMYRMAIWELVLECICKQHPKAALLKGMNITI